MTRSPAFPRTPTDPARAACRALRAACRALRAARRALRAARRVLRPAGLFALALASATCAPPVQGGSVVVSSGAAERLGMLCRWGRGGAEQGDLCPSNAVAARPARVRRIAAPADALSGPLAAGRPGDYLLENDEIAVVVDQLGPGTGVAESGGHLIDAADARARRDELGQIVPRLGVPPRQVIYRDIATGAGADGAAWIEARGEVRGGELAGGALSVTTRYTLGPRDRAVVITTSLRNDGGRPIDALDLGDVVHWGATEHVAPGAAPGLRGEHEAPYLAGIGAGVAYALVPADGAKLRVRSGARFSNVTFARPAALPPGGRVEYQRILAVAPRGDTLAVETELFFLGGGSPGGLALELVDARGAPLPPLVGKATLTPIAEDGATPAAASLDLWLRTGEGGPLAAEAPPGLYLVGFEGSGRRALGSARIRIRDGEIAPARLALSGAGRLSLSVRERDGAAHAANPPLPGRPTPAKISLLDPRTGKAAAPPLFTLSGDLEIPLPPGQLRVVASRGPEFSLAEATVDIAEGGASRLDLTIARVVDTAGYLACDLQQDSGQSADAGGSAAARVASSAAGGVASAAGGVASAAEGVECSLTSEHGAGVDAVEVWTGRDVAARDRALEELWVSLRASRPVTPTATSDAHGLVGAEPGYPRTYVGVPDDDPARCDAVDVVSSLRRRRDVVLTNGPFVTVRLGDARQGGVASARRGSRGAPLSLSIRVERAPWVDARELHVLVGGVESGAPILLEGARTTPAGALLDEIEIPVVLGAGAGRRPQRPDARAGGALGGRGPGKTAHGAISVAEDTFIVAIVRGRRPLDPVLSGEPDEILPFAMTAPLWIDADGDGRSLGRAAEP
ncbi:hypothetical protein [Sorangium sp. So ce1000]|uniref:hypothetical protein n=1 Tax=Sorangium sp. So ce1000 TaxID=3133325 RepID=UPI003F5FAD04